MQHTELKNSAPGPLILEDTPAPGLCTGPCSSLLTTPSEGHRNSTCCWLGVSLCGQKPWAEGPEGQHQRRGSVSWLGPYGIYGISLSLFPVVPLWNVC